MNDVLIVGAGLSGLFAALVAAERNAAVTLVARGRGGLALSHGCIDIWADQSPGAAIKKLPDRHPYTLAGRQSLEAGLESLLRIAAEEGYPLTGSMTSNMRVPTAAGMVRSTAYAPHSIAQAHLEKRTAFSLGGLPALRDFYPIYAAANLERSGYKPKSVISLTLPGQPPFRDLYATDIGREMDVAAYRKELARTWKPSLPSVKRLGLPAVIGLDRPLEALKHLQELLGMELFEIPTLPPSLPGLRLERILRHRALKSAVNVIEGSTAVGLVDGASGGERVSGVVIHSVGGQRTIRSRNVILATGGVMNGGLVASRQGLIQEAVFDLPVEFEPDRDRWTGSSLLLQQPYAPFGIRVDERMQPLDASGKVMFENLFAAGGILAGADRTLHGSRQGIDIATAFRAVESALQ